MGTGIQADEDVTEFSARVYAAKFDFHSGGPGLCVAKTSSKLNARRSSMGETS